MKKLSLTAVIASVFLLSSAANAADPQVEALLSNMRNAYKQVKSAAYTTESTLGTLKFGSTIKYLSPLKVKATVALNGGPGQSRTAEVICDGSNISLRPLGKTEFTIMPYKADDLAAQIPANLESICFFDWDRQLSTAPGKNMEHSTFKITHNQEWDGKNWTVLQETAAAQKVVCQYFIDPKTYLIWRTVVKIMPGGNPQNNADCRITKLSLGAKVDPATFQIVHV